MKTIITDPNSNVGEKLSETFQAISDNLPPMIAGVDEVLPALYTAGKAVLSPVVTSASRFFSVRSIKAAEDMVSGAEKVESMSSKAAFDGKLYPKDKLQQLVKYLERRNVSVYGTEGNPAFIARADGTGQMLLPENPTELQVKHELSHYLDFKKNGFEAYRDMGRANREESVLNRLRQNRVWSELNTAEKEFSIDYVDRLANKTEVIRNER